MFENDKVFHRAGKKAAPVSTGHSPRHTEQPLHLHVDVGAKTYTFVSSARIGILASFSAQNWPMLVSIFMKNPIDSATKLLYASVDCVEAVNTSRMVGMQSNIDPRLFLMGGRVAVSVELDALTPVASQ